MILMAKAFFILSSLLLFTLTIADPDQYYFSKNLSPSSLGLGKKQKLTHLHFYFHDIITAKHPTTVKVAGPAVKTNRSIDFGSVWIMDDPLTVEPDINSKLVGKAQGMFASASQTEIGFLMAFNFVFTEGKFNGSTISVLGRNPILSEVREMPIVGGSGVFRFASGYAQARTVTVSFTTFNAVVEYHVYVFHY